MNVYIRESFDNQEKAHYFQKKYEANKLLLEEYDSYFQEVQNDFNLMREDSLNKEKKIKTLRDDQKILETKSMIIKK